jgi:hypothetical protein
MASGKIREAVVVMLRSDRTRSRRDLHKLLLTQGFKSEDDFYYLPRKGGASWHAPAIAVVNVFLGDASIYETREDITDGDSFWDRLEMEYLMCALPRMCIDQFMAECDAIVGEFALLANVDERLMNTAELRTYMQSLADSTANNFGEPGSEELCILVEEQYRSRPS